MQISKGKPSLKWRWEALQGELACTHISLCSFGKRSYCTTQAGGRKMFSSPGSSSANEKLAPPELSLSPQWTSF